MKNFRKNNLSEYPVGTIFNASFEIAGPVFGLWSYNKDLSNPQELDYSEIAGAPCVVIRPNQAGELSVAEFPYMKRCDIINPPLGFLSNETYIQCEELNLVGGDYSLLFVSGVNVLNFFDAVFTISGHDHNAFINNIYGHSNVTFSNSAAEGSTVNVFDYSVFNSSLAALNVVLNDFSVADYISSNSVYTKDYSYIGVSDFSVVQASGFSIAGESEYSTVFSSQGSCAVSSANFYSSGRKPFDFTTLPTQN